MKWIMLSTLMFSVFSHGYQLIRPNVLNVDQNVLGRGFSLENKDHEQGFFDRLKSDCLQGNIVKYGQSNTQLEVIQRVGFESKDEFSTIKGKSKVDFWIASAKASVKYLMEESSTSTRESNSFILKVKGPKYRFEGVSPIQKKITYGASLCGDGYVHHAEKGITQILTASMEFFSKEKKEAFQAKLKIKLAGGLIKKTLRHKDENKDLFQYAVMSVSHYYEGGMTDHLLSIRDYQPTPSIRYRCTLENMDICIEKFNAFHAYLTSGEYKAKISNEHNYKTMKFGISTYDEAAIDGISRDIPPPAISQYSILISLSHDLQALYAEKVKLESNQLLYDSESYEFQQLQFMINDTVLAINQVNSKIEACYEDDMQCH